MPGNQLEKDPAPAPPDQWTLIRGARQLLTLRGASGPRCGAAMTELNVVSDGAVLLRNGVIDECGPARRIENLDRAKHAREIDATSKVVMPAFVDPNGVLVLPSPKNGLQVISRRVVEAGASYFAAEWARYGVLSMGAHTGSAETLKETVKILRVHRALQGRPLRIRSIISPPLRILRKNADEWFRIIRKGNLASVVELDARRETDSNAEEIKAIALLAADEGFSIRIRCDDVNDSRVCALALEAGVIAWMGLPPSPDHASSLFAGVYVLDVSGPYEQPARDSYVRRNLDDGVAVAITSGYRSDGPASANPQMAMHTAMERFGLSVEEAIVAGTYNAACSLRMSHVTGSLEHGKAADLLVMDVPDYRELARRVGHSDVLLALRGGHPVYRRAAISLPSRQKPELPLS